MSWHAKPKGGYSRTSTEGVENIFAISGILTGRGYTTEAVAGVCGNVQAESGFNPWRWQSDKISLSGGYGLFQYTPASGYINLSGTTPNMSVTTTTAGATPEDGARQVNVFAGNELGKWVQSAWRSYWSTSTYASLYAKRSAWLSAYGHGSGISMSEFAACADVEAATFFMLACFEGPAVPNMSARYKNALAVYEMLGGVTPVPPDPPVPPEPTKEVPIWLLMAIKNNLDRILKT